MRYSVVRNRLRQFLVSLLTLLCHYPACADNNVDALFSCERDTFAGLSLNYRKAQVGGFTRIVLLYLHGGSGQGDDNKSQMRTPAIKDIYGYLVNSGKNFTFLVP
ncbi:MAG: hypothetical protein NC117_07395 [Pseudoflavonifractor sp.]|nr:hypothetical protein [Pseudoflavonifractor sp.]